MDVSPRRTRLRLDRWLLALLMLGALLAGARAWLSAHPQHDPWAPLSLGDPPGWATKGKIAALREDAQACRAVLERSGVSFTRLDPAGEGACARPDRLLLDDAPLAPNEPATCAVQAATEMWLRDTVRPAAVRLFDSELTRIETFGSYSCRRLYGRSEGRWSEHATGNAIDVAAFVLADGSRISVLSDWEGEGQEAQFLREVRDGSCAVFATVLSPEYNDAHRDHFHLDQAARGYGGVCR